MSLDFGIKGDPVAIRQLATWLDPGLANAVDSAQREFTAISGESAFAWMGNSGAAYRQVNDTLWADSAGMAVYARDAAEVFRAYAGQLERMREDFAELASDAMAKGLKVYGFTILSPMTSLTRCPDEDGDPAEVREWNGFASRVADYRALGAEIGTRWGKLEAWVAEHMAPLAERITEFESMAGTFAALEDLNGDVAGGIFTGLDKGWDLRLQEFQSGATAMQQEADMFQKHLRSGNPALRAAAELANPRELRSGLRVLNQAIDSAAHYGRIIPVAGIVVEVSLAAVELADGGSPSSVGVGLVGGAAGAAGAGAMLTLPPVLAAVVVGGAALGGGWVAKSMYEAWVPLDIREAIDAGIYEAPEIIFGDGMISEPTGTWAVGVK